MNNRSLIADHLQKPKRTLILSSLLILSVLSLTGCQKHGSEKETSISKDRINTPTMKPLTLEEEYPHVIKRNVPLYTYLTKMGTSSIDVIEMVKASKPIKNLSRLMPGTRFQLEEGSDGNLIYAKFRFSPLEKLELQKIEGQWKASIIKEAVDIKLISFAGTVESSLWESAQAANIDSYLVMAMAEVFAWEIDFNREVRNGDLWRVTAEKKSVNGEFLEWGSILAAEYVNAGESHKAVLFRNDGKEIGYYTPKGQSLRKMFLKSPLRFGRITSRFNRRRFHPKLKRIRPHNGVDYGAPIGTPVRSVADGVVTFRGRRGGGGKVMKIRHNSIYKTAYKHLSRYKVRKGARVKQGQIIAYTGNTGLSTGPHLHYEFLKHGRFKDPLRQKFPSAEPVAKKLKPAFDLQAKKMIETLPGWESSKVLTP